MARFVVGVTGGVASGKSEACRQFERLGIEVADADLVARAVVAPGQPALADIVQRFGAAILSGDGQLDRRSLRERIFRDAEAKRDLEAITHPRIRALLHEQCAASAGPYVLAAIPLLAEGGGKAAYPWLDRVLVVDTPVALQRTRLLARDGITEALAERMITAQASREQRLAIATDVLVNDGPLAALEGMVARLDTIYRRQAGTGTR